MEAIKDIIQQLGVRVDFVIILLALMLVDIICGVVKALYLGEFKSSIFREGLIKKFFEVVIVCAGYLIDYVLGTRNVGLAVLIMLIGAELYSIIFENAATFVHVPKVLEDAVNSMREEKKEEEIDNGERF